MSIKENKSLREKLEKLQVLVVDEYINRMEEGELTPMELSSIITLLNHNKVVTEAEKEDSFHTKVKKVIKKKQ